MNHMIDGDTGSHPQSPKYSSAVKRISYGDEEDYELINERGESICPICGLVDEEDYEYSGKCICDGDLEEEEDYNEDDY